MSELYDEDEFKQWVRIAWQAHAPWPRRKPPQMDDLRSMVAHALDRMAPHVAAKALREAAYAMGTAEPTEAFARGWHTAQAGLLARAERIEGKS